MMSTKSTASSLTTWSAAGGLLTWLPRWIARSWPNTSRQCTGNGMEFDYLLNAACLGNREWTESFHQELRELLDWLSEIRVDTITIVAPILLQIIKKRYPHFKVKVGIYAQVDTVKRAQYWEDMGADAINLESFSINRDFEKLRPHSGGGALRPAAHRQPLLPAQLPIPDSASERTRPRLEHGPPFLDRLSAAAVQLPPLPQPPVDDLRRTGFAPRTSITTRPWATLRSS